VGVGGGEAEASEAESPCCWNSATVNNRYFNIGLSSRYLPTQRRRVELEPRVSHTARRSVTSSHRTEPTFVHPTHNPVVSQTVTVRKTPHGCFQANSQHPVPPFQHLEFQPWVPLPPASRCFCRSALLFMLHAFVTGPDSRTSRDRHTSSTKGTSHQNHMNVWYTASLAT
jgi:hypothetical protein